MLATYDAIAETFDRFAVPHVFTPPARDLVSMLRLPLRARALDVGTGTGVAALLALRSTGPGSLIAALDSSSGMLRLARKNGLSFVVAGVVPGLPFPDAIFDAVMANFVLSHVSSYQAALLDMARVLRPAGRLGFTAWGSGQSEFRKLWQATAESFVNKEELSSRLRQALPWEEWFSDAGHLEHALRQAGLERIEVHRVEYKVNVPVDDFLKMREITFQARLMNDLLEPEQWESFCEHVRNELYSRCCGTLEDARDAYIAVGTKPNT